MPFRSTDIPSPALAGNIPLGVLQEIGELLPMDKYIGGTGLVTRFFTYEHEEPHHKELNELLKSIARVAIDHFEEVKGVKATDMKLSGWNVNSSDRADVDKWHSDKILPEEMTYIVASTAPTEFAIGHAPFVNKLPSRVPIDGITRGLIQRGQLSIQQHNPGEVVVFDSQHIHRRPAIAEDVSRIAVRFALYNRELSLKGVQSTWHGRVRLAWEEWLHPPYF